MTTSTSEAEHAARAARQASGSRRVAVLLALLALCFYVGFIVMTALGPAR